MNDIIKIARMAATSVYKPSDLGYFEALDAAIEVVCECFNAGEKDLTVILRRCNTALQYEARALRRFRGFIGQDPGRRNEGWVRYFYGQAGHVHSFADDIDDRLAVLQVFWALSERDQEVLWMEACGEREDRPGWRMIVKNARDRAKRVWFDHETPCIPMRRVKEAA